MKKFILASSLVLCALTHCDAQTTDSIPVHGVVAPDAIDPEPDTNPYFVVEEPPMFPGGDSAWRIFVMKTMRHPNPEVEGTVYVRFIVERDGAVTNVEVLKHPNSQALALEARTIVMSSPNWTPGKEHGKVVRCSVVQPIRFTLH